MKNKITAIICFILLGCNRNVNESQTKDNLIIMKKFDIENFKKNTKSGKTEKQCEFIIGDSIFKCRELENSFYEEAKKKNENLKLVSNYYKTTKTLKNSGSSFYSIVFGVSKFYNEQGELIDEINYDENFSFSVYDLINKIKDVYDIDLKNTTKIANVIRGFDKSNNKFYYNILFKKSEGQEENTKFITVDGQTGEIIDEGNLSVNAR